MLHFLPDLLSGQAFTASGENDLAGGDFVFLAKTGSFRQSRDRSRMVWSVPFRAIAVFPDCTASKGMEDPLLTRTPLDFQKTDAAVIPSQVL